MKIISLMFFLFISSFSIYSNIISYYDWGDIGINYNINNNDMNLMIESPGLYLCLKKIPISLEIDPMIYSYDFKSSNMNFNILETTLYHSMFYLYKNLKFRSNFENRYTHDIGSFINVGYTLKNNDFYYLTGIRYSLKRSYKKILVNYYTIELGYSLHSDHFYGNVSFDLIGIGKCQQSCRLI